MNRILEKDKIERSKSDERKDILKIALMLIYKLSDEQIIKIMEECTKC